MSVGGPDFSESAVIMDAEFTADVSAVCAKYGLTHDELSGIMNRHGRGQCDSCGVWFFFEMLELGECADCRYDRPGFDGEDGDEDD